MELMNHQVEVSDGRRYCSGHRLNFVLERDRLLLTALLPYRMFTRLTSPPFCCSTMLSLFMMDS